ncbi:MAG: ATP-binding protein [Gammaproteobacteria bacterium]
MNHFKFLWNGGLDPELANPVILRERRVLSSTILFAIPLAVAMMVANSYMGGERDNVYIAVATGVLVVSLYIQAYFNAQVLASQLPIFAFWVVMCLAMMTVGVWGNTWAWLLTVPAIASLVAGRVAGVIWAVICGVTLWGFAYLHGSGYEFEFAPPLTVQDTTTLAWEGSLVLLMLTHATFIFRSGQVNAERRLNETVRELEKEVHDRTIAENEARQSEQAKASFLAAMSHELRTPLNGVVGASQLLSNRSDLTDGGRELVNVISRSSENLIELINNVLDLSRLDSNELELEAAPIEIRELLDHSLAALAFQAKEKGLNFAIVVEDDIPDYIEGDPTRLRQVLINLVGNAVKFTNSGEITLILDTAMNRMRLRIIDTGIGIAKSAQASLFEPYVQAEATIVRRYGGSGLGLSIVKRLVTAMGGRIMVQSTPGRGSIFTVFLPLEPSGPPEFTSTELREYDVPPLYVLVADDNAVNRMVLSRLLEEDGHDVVSVSNGKEAVEYYRDHRVDVIMMDLQMPVMDGVSATRKVRSMSYGKSSVPIIAVTANVVTEKPEKFLAAGMNAVLAKPYKKEELRAALAEVVASQPIEA